jgi:hypothetical protein
MTTGMIMQHILAYHRTLHSASGWYAVSKLRVNPNVRASCRYQVLNFRHKLFIIQIIRHYFYISTHYLGDYFLLFIGISYSLFSGISCALFCIYPVLGHGIGIDY